jgi:Flp pilus assembly pilin Flp
MTDATDSTLPQKLPSRLASTVRRFAVYASATTSIEYAILTFIAVAVIAVVTQLGSTVTGMYERVLEIFN